MNRLFTLILIGLAGLLASCGSSVVSSTQPGSKDIYSMVVSPVQFTLNAGDWSSVTARVELSNKNSAPKAVSPQPTIKFFSSDRRVSVSPAGEVCAGQWDTKFLTCTQTTNPTTGLLDAPTGYVTITAFDATRNVGAASIVSVHERATSIALNTDWGGRTCISQNDPKNPNNNQVKYTATPVGASGPLSNVFPDDYTWIVADSNVASVSAFGFVIARNPGVTSVFAKLNGTTSTPLTFVTCPPSSILLESSQVTNGTPVAPFSTADLSLKKGDRKFLTATLIDTNLNPLITSQLNYVASDPLAGTFSNSLPLTSTLTASTAGRFSVLASCAPPNCNASVANFTLPNSTTPTTGKALGFGFPIYSNVIGVTVAGITGSTVLVSGANLTNGAPAHLLQAFDSESLAVTHTVALANTPNSMVVAPNGAKAYLGSNDGLIVLDLASYQQSVQNFPVVGGVSTDVVTGRVLGVSPDSRYVLLSDACPTISDPNLPPCVSHGLVFLIDTTVGKNAVRYTIPGVRAVAFAADDSNFWIGGDLGVYVFNSDTFVPTLTNGCVPLTSTCTQVTGLAWMPDGQSYFASGQVAGATTSQLINYSTCEDGDPQPQALPGTPSNLATTVLSVVPSGVPHVIGLAGSQWFDYSVTTPAQVPTPAQPSNPTKIAKGNVCPATITVNPPVTQPSGSPCTAAQQISFSPTLQQAFVTGVNPSCAAQPFIFGYDVSAQKTLAFSTTNPVIPLGGGVLNDGRKLYFGTDDSSGATLHRINFDSTAGPLGEDASTSVALVPSFVAVVPK